MGGHQISFFSQIQNSPHYPRRGGQENYGLFPQFGTFSFANAPLSQNFYSTILLTVFYKSITCALQGQGFFLTYHFPTRTLTIKSQMAISKLQNHRQDLERGYDLSRKDIDDRIAPSSCIVLEFFHAYALIRILVC